MPEYYTPIPGFNRFNNDYWVHKKDGNFFHALDTIEPSAVFITPDTFTSPELPVMSFVDDKPSFSEYLQFINMPSSKSWILRETQFWQGYDRLKKRAVSPVHIYYQADADTQTLARLYAELEKRVQGIHQKLIEGPAADTSICRGACIINEFSNSICQVFLPADSDDPQIRAGQVQRSGQEWLQAVSKAADIPGQLDINRYIYRDTSEELIEATRGNRAFRTYQYTDDADVIMGQLSSLIEGFSITRHTVDMPPHPGV